MNQQQTKVQQLLASGYIVNPLTPAEQEVINNLTEAEFNFLMSIGSRLKAASALPAEAAFRPLFI